MLWVATQTGGINKFDSETELFTQVGGRMQIMQIYADNANVHWVATWQGLKKLDLETEQFFTYWHNPNNPKSISSNQINSIYEDKSGLLWIGTNGGLNKYNRAKEEFTHYSRKDGLPNDVIYGILEDEHKNLWLSTNNGISKFNLKTEIFRN